MQTLAARKSQQGTFRSCSICSGLGLRVCTASIQQNLRLCVLRVLVRNAGTRAILDSRQKALKLTANALYGFTGAMASPLQSVALADGCLALGSQVRHLFKPLVWCILTVAIVTS